MPRSHSAELEFYKAVEAKLTLTMNAFLKKGELMANMTSVLSMLLRMRQACSHPSLITKSSIEDKDALEDSALSRPATPPPSASNKASSVDDLLSGLEGLSVGPAPKCALCNEPTPSREARYCALCDAQLGKYSRLQFSTKIKRLLKCLEDIRREGKGRKTIIFSQVCSDHKTEAASNVH